MIINTIFIISQKIEIAQMVKKSAKTGVICTSAEVGLLRRKASAGNKRLNTNPLIKAVISLTESILNGDEPVFF